MTATVKVRHSADDRKGPRTSSPFRSKAPSTRLIAAQQMVIKRLEEIVALERALGQTGDRAEQRRLTTRLLASKNNLRSWQDYIAQNSPREPRAVITPAA